VHSGGSRSSLVAVFWLRVLHLLPTVSIYSRERSLPIISVTGLLLTRWPGIISVSIIDVPCWTDVPLSLRQLLIQYSSPIIDAYCNLREPIIDAYCNLREPSPAITFSCLHASREPFAVLSLKSNIRRIF